MKFGGHRSATFRPGEAMWRHRVLTCALLTGMLPGRGAPIVLALTALLTIVSLVPRGGAATAAGVAAFAFTDIAWKWRAPGASSLGLLFVTCLALALVGIGPQQVMFGLAFAIYAVVASRVPWFRQATCWLTVGRFDGRMMALSAACAALSGAPLHRTYPVIAAGWLQHWGRFNER
jgi:hypothetical protein